MKRSMKRRPGIIPLDAGPIKRGKNTHSSYLPLMATKKEETAVRDVEVLPESSPATRFQVGVDLLDLFVC